MVWLPSVMRAVVVCEKSSKPSGPTAIAGTLLRKTRKVSPLASERRLSSTVSASKLTGLERLVFLTVTDDDTTRNPSEGAVKMKPVTRRGGPGGAGGGA